MMKKILLIIVVCFASWSYAQSLPKNPEDISPLLIGEKLPNASLKDIQGNIVEIKTIIDKPTVVVFYRGGWCPYCNSQLSGLSEIENDILDLGYQIVAITPEDYRNLKSIENENHIKYTLYSDEQGAYIQKVGIAFQIPIKLKSYLALKNREGTTANALPVPTVMIVNKNRTIVFEYINPNYKERLKADLLLATLKTLANRTDNS